jgi:oligopeptide/dipeptide ABC transporter ATP-binding protein
MAAAPGLLEVRNLGVRYAGVAVVRDVSFCIAHGEVAGLLGESGCGKSTAARAILGLLPEAAASGSVSFDGRELLGLPEPEWRRIRGAEVSLIFQEPRSALNPVMRIGAQVAEVIRAHRGWPAARCSAEARETLCRVGLDARFCRSYPHQLSGGQLQRVLIAQALACAPALVLADEPTASLDTVTQAAILELLRGLKANSGLGMLLITHHPAILNGFAERVLVMYAGQIVEAGPREQVYSQPLHPYTAALLRCVPRPSGADRHLPAIPGDPPDFASLPPGCAFAPRCERRVAACQTNAPGLSEAGGSRQVRCHLYAR